MIIEVIVLAMASTIRPASLAAIFALLAHDSRRALMVAQVIGGLMFTIFFGLVVVYAFHGIHIHAGSGRTRAIADIVGGIVALGFALALVTGRVHKSPVREAPEAAGDGRLQTMLDERVTTRTAVLAGPATHVPGVFYLIALNVIVAHNARVPAGTFAVVTYNAVWFALPILALVLCITNPDAARNAIGAVERWAQEHSNAILLSVSVVVGTALIVRGSLGL